MWDKDTFSPDDIMGEAVFDLKNVYTTPNKPFRCNLNLILRIYQFRDKRETFRRIDS